jgi:hypothetical protein
MLRRTQAPFMKPQHDKPASGPEKPSKPSRMEEACRIVAEYADDLREILKKFRKLTSALLHSEPRTKIALRHV